MLEFQVDTRALEEIRRRFDQAPGIVRSELEAGTRDATDATRDAIRAETPTRTGALRGSIVSRFSAVGSASFRGEVAVLNPGARYGRFVNEGTRAHLIRPRYREALRFVSGGRTVFARSVRHPGTRPNPFWERGIARARPRVVRIMAARLGNVRRRLERGG